MSAEPHLSRRERQIMDALHQRGCATAAEVRGALPDAPSYSAVRALLRILEAKGHVKHLKERARYVYKPRVSPETARRSALRRLVSTFFGGSAAQAAAALLEHADTRFSELELQKLEKMIEQARKEGR